MTETLRQALAHPRTRGLDLDDPATTERRREIVKSKGLLKRIYYQWYAMIKAGLSEVGHLHDGQILELGSGGGFLTELIDGLITSEVFHCKHVTLAADALALPFAPASLRGIVMINVFHHIPNVKRFFREADLCVSEGGTIVMIEPWLSQWSKLVYTRLHHEPLLPEATEWSFPSTGPLSGSNGALPWIVFERDRAVFEREFPHWEIKILKPIMPFQYLLSGGVSMRSFAPGWSCSAWKALEAALSPWMKHWGMFATIVLQKRTPPPADE